jgi:hypothetical protein
LSMLEGFGKKCTTCVNGLKFCRKHGIGRPKFNAIVKNLADYGLFLAERAQLGVGVCLVMTKLGRAVIESDRFPKYIHACFMRPFPNEEEARAFWAQRGISVES